MQLNEHPEILRKLLQINNHINDNHYYEDSWEGPSNIDNDFIYIDKPKYSIKGEHDRSGAFLGNTWSALKASRFFLACLVLPFC